MFGFFKPDPLKLAATKEKFLKDVSSNDEIWDPSSISLDRTPKFGVTPVGSHIEVSIDGFSIGGLLTACLAVNLSIVLVCSKILSLKKSGIFFSL